MLIIKYLLSEKKLISGRPFLLKVLIIVKGVFNTIDMVSALAKSAAEVMVIGL